MFERQSDQMAGQGLLEYGLAIVLVAVIVIGALALLGPVISGMYDQVVTALSPPPGDDTSPPPPECYGTLLLPIMLTVAGLGLGVSYLFPRREPAAATVDL